MKNQIIKSILVLITSITISFGVSAQQCVQCDENSNASGNHSSVMGMSSLATADGSFAGGFGSEANGAFSFAFGNQVIAESTNSVAFGRFIEATASPSIIFGTGTGLSPFEKLINNVSNSLMIGFNSNRPTLFVGMSDGLGYTGKIGIGDVTDPHAKLHIKADNNEHVDLLLEPGGSSNFAKIKFGEISLNNSPNRIEAKQDGDLDFYTASDYVFRDGNVGIGLTNPLEKLEVDGNIKQSTGFHILTDKINAAGTNGLMLQDGTGNGIVIKNNGKVGIGIAATNPSSELEVDGTIFTKHFRLDNTDPVGDPLTGFDGHLLQADEFGNASWADPTSINDGDWETNGDDIYNMNSGNVGIGVDNPIFNLHIKKSATLGLQNENTVVGGEIASITAGDANYANKAKIVFESTGEYGEASEISFYTSSEVTGTMYKALEILESKKLMCYGSSSFEGRVSFNNDIHLNGNWIKNVGNGNSGIFLDNGNNVGIGTDTPGAALDVNGNIKANSIETENFSIDEFEIGTLTVTNKLWAGEVEVTDVTSWQDAVFQETYPLAPLSEVEEFIKKHHHLKNIPSEAEVLSKGYSIGEMDALLLQKIEELTLYVIELEKKIKLLEE